MARLVTLSPESTPAEWGKRLAYLACVLLPVLLLIVLLVNERQPVRLRWDSVTLSSPPPMPASDFLREVRAIGRFADPLDLNEPELFSKLYKAFQQHDWVEKVERVGLTGIAKWQVDLTFRRPVAKIEKGAQVHLVDRQGKVLLPLYPQQSIGLVSLIGWNDRNTESTPWLLQAVELADQMKSELSIWKITSIQLYRDPSLDVVDLRFRTQSGTYIIWQSLKGSTSDEPSISEKLSRLRVYHERFGNLEAPPGHVLDVRNKEGLQRRPASP